jgi:hypothetical protein
MTVAAIVEGLKASPVAPEVARRKPADGGVPAVIGLYAWWTDLEALGGLPLSKPSRSDLALVYVGSAPQRAGSGQSLRSRICGVDLVGGITRSALRRTLCALLWQDKGWRLSHRGKEICLAEPGQAALQVWQEAHLRVSWLACATPWEALPFVAKTMRAPLNLAESRTDPNSWLISEARQRLRSAALTSTP